MEVLRGNAMNELVEKAMIELIAWFSKVIDHAVIREKFQVLKFRF